MKKNKNHDRKKTNLLPVVIIVFLLVACGYYFLIVKNKTNTNNSSNSALSSKGLQLENIDKTITIPIGWNSPTYQPISQDSPNCGTYTLTALENKVNLSIQMICPSVSQVWYEGIGTLSSQSLKPFEKLENTGGYDIYWDPEKYTKEVDGKKWRYYVFHKGKNIANGYEVFLNDHKVIVSVLVEESVDPKTELNLLADTTVIFRSLLDN